MSKKLEFEAGQNAFEAQLTDSGDHKEFNSQAEYFSMKSGFAPVVTVNGILTGGEMSVSGTTVTVASLTCNLNGQANQSVVSGSVNITDPATDTHLIHSVVVNAAGALEVISGAEGTSFSDERGAAGGPSYIPVDAIEIGQVRVDDLGTSVNRSVKQVPNLHKEMALSPVFKTVTSKGNVVFSTALPQIHVGDITKAVYITAAEPIFATVDYASDFQPSEETISITSEETYSGTTGSQSKSLNTSTFKAKLEDGITDPLIKLKGENLWFRFYPDEYVANCIMEQGVLGVSRQYPTSGKVSADFTIAVEQAGILVEG